MLHLDGSLGEGGGQILRSAIALSLVTGQPFRIEGIRRNRSKPGLRRQHLAAVLAAAEIGDAVVDGAALDSATLTFRPGRIRAGEHRIVVGSAGSTVLVLQTLLPALLLANAPSSLFLSGGTHNPQAPPFEFLERAFAPLLRRMGAGVELQLVRVGFAPAGGGAITVRIVPADRLQPLCLLVKGAAGPLRAWVLTAGLPTRIGMTVLDRLCQRMTKKLLHPENTRLAEVQADGTGCVLIMDLPAEGCHEVVATHGGRGIPAYRVADVAADLALPFLAAGVPVGPFLADQLLLPLALAGGGTFRTVLPTLHTRTNAAVIERFLSVRVTIQEDEGAGSWTVAMQPRGEGR